MASSWEDRRCVVCRALVPARKEEGKKKWSVTMLPGQVNDDPACICNWCDGRLDEGVKRLVYYILDLLTPMRAGGNAVYEKLRYRGGI